MGEIVTAKQQLSKHTLKAMDINATIEELWEVVFSVQSVPRIHNKDEWKSQLVKDWFK